MNLSLLLALVLSFNAGLSQEDAIQAELKKLDGTWNVTALESAGIKLPDNYLKQENMAFVFKSDKMTVKKGTQTVTDSTVKIDPAKSPKTLDATATDGMGKGKTILIIYELTGDSLKIARYLPGTTGRPSGFDDKANLMVFTLTRQK